MILIFMVCMELAIAHFRIPPEKPEKKTLLSPESSNATMSLAMMLVNIAIFAVLFVTDNIAMRSGFEVDSQNVSHQILNILRFFPVASFMITWMQMQRKHTKYRIDLLVYAMEIAIIYFPFYGSVSRFLLFGVYLTVVSLLFSHTKGKGWYFLFLSIGFVVVLSSFNFFKYNDFSDIGNFKLIQTGFIHADFDAYQMLMTTINYTHDVGVCFGKNILTSVFSFVPRSIWTGKMLPTGQLALQYYGATFTNVSCPWIAEWYFAFGWFGIPIGGIVTGILMKWVDSFNVENGNFFKRAIFCIIAGLSIYIFRGAMLPTFSFTFALVLTTMIVCFMFKLMAGFTTAAKK